MKKIKNKKTETLGKCIHLVLVLLPWLPSVAGKPHRSCRCGLQLFGGPQISHTSLFNTSEDFFNLEAATVSWIYRLNS
ncbi:hypothetical protein H5410_014345 [Solanum commersonii]|uniref:Secreted protein n=1 Tax=Solanum commersonii TaxID=4109 RepID=A0A9J5ZQP5_SOLCO|nr:hypothetical protein H5410_014345 [Solanum commersonii]